MAWFLFLWNPGYRVWINSMTRSLGVFVSWLPEGVSSWAAESKVGLNDWFDPVLGRSCSVSIGGVPSSSSTTGFFNMAVIFLLQLMQTFISKGIMAPWLRRRSLDFSKLTSLVAATLRLWLPKEIRHFCWKRCVLNVKPKTDRWNSHTCQPLDSS